MTKKTGRRNGREEWRLTPQGAIDARHLYVVAMAVKMGIADNLPPSFDIPNVREMIKDEPLEGQVAGLIILQSFYPDLLKDWGETIDERRALATKVISHLMKQEKAGGE